METELTITQLTENTDDFDRFIHEDILLIAQDQQAMTLVDNYSSQYLGIEKGGEEFLDKILRAGTALLKANAHLRNYKRLTPLLGKNIEDENDFSKTNVAMLFNKVDAMIELEGFLSQLKTALDLLAQSLRPIIGKFFQTYGKSMVSGKELSGAKISNYLERSVKAEIKNQLDPLKNLILEHAENITDLVQLRDDYVHNARSKRVQGFRYSVKDKKLSSPTILFKPDEALFVDTYMEQTLAYILGYSQDFLLTILSNLLSDMVRKKGTDGNWAWFSNGS